MPNVIKWKGKKCKGNTSQTQTCKKGQWQTWNIQNADNAVEMNGNNEYTLWMSGSHLDGHGTSGTQWQLPRKWGKPLFNHRNLKLLHWTPAHSTISMTSCHHPAGLLNDVRPRVSIRLCRPAWESRVQAFPGLSAQWGLRGQLHYAGPLKNLRCQPSLDTWPSQYHWQSVVFPGTSQLDNLDVKQLSHSWPAQQSLSKGSIWLCGPARESQVPGIPGYSAQSISSEKRQVFLYWPTQQSLCQAATELLACWIILIQGANWMMQAH